MSFDGTNIENKSDINVKKNFFQLKARKFMTYKQRHLNTEFYTSTVGWLY